VKITKVSRQRSEIFAKKNKKRASTGIQVKETNVVQ